MIRSYVSIDLETTGLNPKRDKIIEIGAVKVLDDKIADTFSTLLLPGRALDDRITQLTGITDEMLKDAPYIEDVLDELLNFLEELPLLGHSVLFDYSFLKKAAVNQKKVFEKNAIDTLKIARKHLAALEHRNLDYLCAYYQIPLQAHRALADAEATHRLYRRLAEQFYTKEDALFLPAPLHFQVKKDTPATGVQKKRLYRLAAQHNIALETDVERLTRSEADRLLNKLSAVCGR